MLAASTASALPSPRASTICCGSPQPPGARGRPPPAPRAAAGRAGRAVEGGDEALRAEALSRPPDEKRVGDGGAVQRDLVGAELEEEAGVLLAADAAADGEGDEDLGGRALHHLVGRAAVVR